MTDLFRSGGIHTKQSAYVSEDILLDYTEWQSSASTVLVLGMCFFAGGLKYQEQGFGAGM